MSPEQIEQWNARVLARRQERVDRAAARQAAKIHRHAVRAARILKDHEQMIELPIDTDGDGG